MSLSQRVERARLGSDAPVAVGPGPQTAPPEAANLPGRADMLTEIRSQVQVEVIAKLKRPKAKNRRVGDAL